MWANIRSAIRRIEKRRRDRRDYENLLQYGEHAFYDIGIARDEVERLYRSTWLR